MAVINIKNLTDLEPRFVGGHRLCAGCNEGTIVRQVLLAAHEYEVVVLNATGCLEVTTSVYPYTSWNVPWLHEAFENVAAAARSLPFLIIPTLSHIRERSL